MYEGYWKLSRRPFDDGAVPEFFFPARTHQAALLKLRYLVEQKKGIGLIVGEHGLGKSFLTHVLEHEPHGEGIGPFVRLVIPQLNPSGTLAYLAGRLGAEFHEHAPDQTVLRVLETRLEAFRDAGQRPVLVIDDAQLLDVPHLNMLRLLLNLREEGRGEFSIILSGRTELLARLTRIAALDQRVMVRAALLPLEADEVLGYVQHRTQAAGCRERIFHERSARTIWELSQGIPRRINQICDLAMLVGFADDLKGIGPVELEAAAEELHAVAA